ncbi:MAG: DUF6125 family protein [Candidatus Zixiibacteriota bacterium]
MGIDTFKDLPKGTLLGMLEDFAKNWLAHDGLWFQEVEKQSNMDIAIELDTNAWRRFSAIEAKRIMQRHHIPENGGLEALKEALKYRLYSALNEQAIVEEGDNWFMFAMIDCRVQSARRRKNMPLFPCKSVGKVEYEVFSSTIDPRIKCEVIAAPPDEKERDYYCGWKFSI